MRQELLDELEDTFWHAISEFSEFRLSLVATDSPHWSVWPEDEISFDAARAATSLFHEIATTSRFSPSESPGDTRGLSAAIYPAEPLQMWHAAALCALVLLEDAAEALSDDDEETVAEYLAAADKWLATVHTLHEAEREATRRFEQGALQQLRASAAALSARNRRNARPGESRSKRLSHVSDEERARFILAEQSKPGATYALVIEAAAEKWKLSDSSCRAEYTRLKRLGLIPAVQRASSRKQRS